MCSYLWFDQIFSVILIWLTNRKNSMKLHRGKNDFLSQIILAILIIPAFLIILCSENVVFSNKTRIWRLCEIIIPAGVIGGNTVVYELLCKFNKRLSSLNYIGMYSHTWVSAIQLLIDKVVLRIRLRILNFLEFHELLNQSNFLTLFE